MKAEELRIGNKILRKGYLPEDNTFHLITVSYHDIEACSKGSYHFKPVELTEEWLLKFGFKKVRETSIFEYYHYENEYCWIYLFDNGFELELITGDERFNLCKRYQCVHKLQNLYFVLVGEELEMKF